MPTRLRYHLPRACLAGAAAAASFLVLAFRWAPQQVDQVGEWRKASVERAVLDEWTAAMRSPGTPAFSAWCESLATVRTRDRMLPLAKESLRLAVATAVQAEDTPGALHWGTLLIALDDRDLASIAQVGRLLARDAEQRERGLALLRRGAEAAPDSALVVPVLFEALVGASRWEEAAAVLARAAACVPDNRWQIRWSDSALDRAWVMPLDAGAGRRVARFSLVRRPDCLTIVLPWRAAMALGDFQLWTADAAGVGAPCDPESLVLASGLVRRGDELIADGADDAVLRAPEARFAGSGPWTVALRWRHGARLADWLAALSLGEACGRLVRQEPPLIEQLRALRRRAFAERRPQLGMVVDGRFFTVAAVAETTAIECRDAVAWSAEWSVPVGAQAVAVLPAALPGGRHHLRRVAVRADESAQWQAVAIAAYCDLQPSGGHHVVAGARPRFEFAARPGPCTVRVEGELW